MLKALIPLPILLLVAAAAAPAQTPVQPSAPITSTPWDAVKSLAPGTEVRVEYTHAKSIEGMIESVTETEMVLLKQGSGPRSLDRSKVTSVSIKGKGHRPRNVLIGLGASAAAGTGIGALVVGRYTCGVHCIASGAIVLGGASWEGYLAVPWEPFCQRAGARSTHNKIRRS